MFFKFPSTGERPNSSQSPCQKPFIISTRRSQMYLTLSQWMTTRDATDKPSPHNSGPHIKAVQKYSSVTAEQTAWAELLDDLEADRHRHNFSQPAPSTHPRRRASRLEAHSWCSGCAGDRCLVALLSGRADCRWRCRCSNGRLGWLGHVIGWQRLRHSLKRRPNDRSSRSRRHGRVVNSHSMGSQKRLIGVAMEPVDGDGSVRRENLKLESIWMNI